MRIQKRISKCEVIRKSTAGICISLGSLELTVVIMVLFNSNLTLYLRSSFNK